ncbi:MAG: glucose 1-dehydrogenase [Chloroflexi bacterium]|nr:glucose 1-dehydrogenase [Chloroflexota bacterium]
MQDSDYRLEGQVGIVTGAANGIGQALAIGLAQAGADIVICDLPAQHQQAEQTAQAVTAVGCKALVLELDVRSAASIETAVSSACNSFGRLDFLVNNAGVNIRRPFLEYSEAEWDAISSVNLKGVFFMSQAAARQMVRQQHGKIVSIASQLAAVAMQNRSIYAVTKAGVAHMMKALAVELGPYGITANAVGPTFVATQLSESMFKDPAFIAENLPRIPAGRFGSPGDVLGAVRFLLSPAADLVNGHLLLVDGGYTCW